MFKINCGKFGILETILKTRIEQKINIPLRFELLHDLQEIIVNLRLRLKFVLDLVQVRQGIFNFEPLELLCGSRTDRLAAPGRPDNSRWSSSTTTWLSLEANRKLEISVYSFRKCTAQMTSCSQQILN